jgi:PucR family transcriptional regulator, purine catabolism regulatory protein
MTRDVDGRHIDGQPHDIERADVQPADIEPVDIELISVGREPAPEHATGPAAQGWRTFAGAEGLPDGARLDPAVRALLDRPAAVIRREEQAHRILNRIVLAGGSLAELCGDLVSVLGEEGRAAAFVTTTDGRVLAEGGHADALDQVHGLDCFDRSGRLLVESEPVGVRIGDGERMRRAMVRIIAGSTDLGRIAAFSMDRAFDEEDTHLLQRAATVAALAMTKEQAVAAVESKYRAEFLRDALSGRAGRDAEAIAHAESLGWNIDRPMVVVVAETDEDDVDTHRSVEEVRALQQRFVRAWLQAISTRDPSVPAAGFSQEVVALFPVAEHQDTASVMRSVSAVVRVVSGEGGGGRRTFATGVSRPVTSLADLPHAYEEALKAVSVGRQMHGTSSVAHFDDLGIYRLLALIPDTGDLQRFVEESLGELATVDSPDNADLRRTLSVLIDTNMNVAETSRILFFHYNTLRYRIAKLERMLGPFGSDPQLRLTLALALRIHEMRGI